MRPAQFIPYGATLTNLFVNDKSGKEVDVVLGYDDASYYGTAQQFDSRAKGVRSQLTFVRSPRQESPYV